MGFSIKRVNTLVIKEIKDLIRNVNVFVVSLIPLVGAIFFSLMSSEKTFNTQVLSLIFVMNSTLITPMTMAMLIAEEKEKNTLRTLMLSTVSPMEFLIGKAIVTWILVGITNLAIFFILETPMQYLPMYIVVAFLISTIMILIGAIVGILSKNVMSSGTNSMPVILLFYFIPTLGVANETLGNIAKLLPTYHSQLLMNDMFSNENIFSIGKQNFIVLLIWIIISFIGFTMIYKRKRID
ncbi:ABC transporter permease [Vallitalea guaymasensis]|uniref:ABC transporter permease n=1 Tax=Vallitalea guaymasensis TaxID=1185412 RepID=UPI00272AE826|nr:ABC transporter permease [Vallitalea guaymasensis]